MAPTHTKPQHPTGLPQALKAGIEALSGMSMGKVRVHYNAPQPAQLHAHAFALGSDIHAAPEQGERPPHAAWHVVQQAQGRVKPTVQRSDVALANDDEGLEREADDLGAKAGKSAKVKLHVRFWRF